MKKFKISKETRVLIITILIAWMLLLIAFLIGDSGVIGNVIIISVFLVVSPQLILRYVKYKELKEIELAFPNFLRDLADATNAGLPLHKAIISLGNNNYGPLTKEVKKMASQLSWSIDLINVLEQSKERFKTSPNIEKIIRILIEAYKSGGRIPEILKSLSNTLITIQETEKERESSLKQYVVAIYVITFVFVGVIVAINELMMPIFETSVTGPGMSWGISGTNPCSFCVHSFNFECLPCKIYSSICSVFNIDTISISCYYFGLFFCMGVMQSIMGGLVAGQIGEGSVKAGFKHSLILTSITVAAFMILVRLGVIGG